MVFLRADMIKKETFKQDILLLVYSKKEQISFPVPPVPMSHHTISLHRACLKAQQAYPERTEQMETILRAKVKIFFKSENLKKCF